MTIQRCVHMFVRVSIFVILLLSPLAFGAVHRGSLFCLQLWIALMGLTYVLTHRWALAQFQLLRRYPYLVPFLFFCLGIWLQTIPMPIRLLNLLSPKTVQIYQSLFFPMSLNWETLSFNPAKTQEGLLFALALSVLFILIMQLSASEPAFDKSLLAVVVAIGVVEAAYGLAVYILKFPYLLWFRLEGIPGDATGTFVNRNHFAGYLLLTIPLCLGLWLSKFSDNAGGMQKPSTIGRRIYPLCLILMVLALVYSHSRMGIASLLAALACFAVLSGKLVLGNWKIWAGAMICLVMLGYGLVWDRGFDIFKFRLLELDPRSEYFKITRIPVWQGSLAIVGDFPLFGTGIGTFQYVYPIYSKEIIHSHYSFAHSDWLQLLVETGIVGFGLVVVSFLWFLTRSIRRLGLYASGRDKALVIGLMSGVLAFSFQNLVEFNMHIPSNALLFTVYLALIARRTPQKTLGA